MKLKRLKKAVSLLLATTMVCGSWTGMESEAKETDPDLAKGATIVADCPVHQSGKYNVAPINDGDDATGWLSETYATSQHKKHWVYVDFGKPKTFDQVRLVWDNTKFAEDYKIQVSNTARDSDWHDCAKEKGNQKGGEKVYDIEPTTARYIRVYSTKNVTKDETIQLNTFSVLKNKKDVSDKEAVTKDLKSLTDDFIKTSSSLYEEIANKDLQHVKASLNLPKTGFASSEIEWSVSPDDGKINVDTGEVIRSDVDKDYELTATVTKGEVEETKKFDITVEANKVLASQIVEMEDRTYLELNGSPFLYVTVQNCGTQQLNGHAAAFKDSKPKDYQKLYGDADTIPLEYLENMFEKMHDLGYKHMGIIFKWRDWEPKNPGEYDWTVVDQYIEWCDKYDMSWDIVYFGSNSCGGTRLTNGNVGQDQWWMRNVPEYLDKHDGYWHNGDYVGVNHCPVLKGENYEYLKANEIRAIQDLMDHIAKVDKNKRTATFQVMNEPDWHTRYNTEDKRWVQEWISDVAVAIKASDYSLVTRVNGGYGMPHEDYIPITKLPGVDMCGDDAYTTSINTIKDIFQKDLYDAGFPHIAENDGSFSNTSSLVLSTLLYGGGYHGWQFNDHSWDQGMADTAANGPYYTWQLGKPIKWRESGQDMSRLNPSMNKISDKLACAPLDAMAGFNLETDNPGKSYQKLKMLDGTYVGYECNDASVALAVKDGNDVYLVSDSASTGDGTVNFMSYQEILSASYVGYYKDEIGVPDAEKEWVEEQPIEVVQGEDGIYRVPVKAGEAIKVTFGDSKLASIQELTTTEGTLTPEFDANTHEYSVSVGADVNELSVNAVLTDENANYSVNGKTFASGVSSQKIPLQFGETQIKVKVIWDGLEIDTEDNRYTINVHRSEIDFNGGTYENVAFKKKISSPNYSGGWWHGIGNAVDGSENTLAQPASPVPVWDAQIDLGAEHAVDRIRLVADPKVNIPIKFKVNVSKDGKEWTTVAMKENFKGGTYDVSFAPQMASYIQIDVEEASTGNDCGWVAKEIEVYGVKGGTAGELSAKKVAESILSIPAYNGEGKLSYPKTPYGFTVTVEKSSNEQIVSLDGTVTLGKFDESVYLQFKVVNDTDKEDVAYSRTLPVVIKSKGTTPQNINLALNKNITGTSGSDFELAVDGDRGTRYVASSGYPQSITVDLGSTMEINQIVTTWDASRPGEYKLLTSNDQKNWEEKGTFVLDREGTVVDDIEPTNCRYVKLEATKRGPNTNVFAIMELEVYNKMTLPKKFVLQDIALSEGTLSPAFDKNVTSYSAVVDCDTIKVTASQEGKDAYVFVNGEKTMSGTASKAIELVTGKNVITVSVQDPKNTSNVVNYQIEVVKKGFPIDDYTNVVLNKEVTTPGFDVGYWHPLKQINDGNLSTFAQSSSKEVLDYQFDLNGCFMVDEFEIYTGNNNRPTSFDVKVSLDKKNWKTVCSVNDFDPAVTKYEFEPTYAQYVLVDTKTSDGSWMAVNEIMVNGIPTKLTAEVVAKMFGNMEITSKETSVSLPKVPEGYTVSIQDSNRPEVIAVDGTVNHTEQYEEVELTLEVKNGEDVANAVITVTIQPKKLTNQAVLDKIVSQIVDPQKDQTMMILPEAPAGFTVTYRADQDGSGVIRFEGNVMIINAGLSDFSLPIGITVSGEEGADAVDYWRPTFFKGRSKTAQEVLDGVQVHAEGEKVVVSSVEEGYQARIIASTNQNVVDTAGNITIPDTTTAVDVYVQVVKESDQTTSEKVFSLVIEGKADKTTLSELITLANEKLKEASQYTPESVEILIDVLEKAEACYADATAPQKVLDKAVKELQAAVDGLEKIEEPSKVDKTLLQKTYDYALTLDTDGVTDSAKSYFEKVLAEAKVILDKDNATQEEVNAAWNNLLEGIWGLGIVQGDKTNLGILIDRADAMMKEQDRYVQDNWQQLVDALAAAKGVMDEGDALKDDVEKAADDLLNAILAQRYKANKDNLKDLIDKANGLDLSKYTKESANALKAALKAADAVMADDSLSIDDQTKVAKAEKDLQAALDGLKFASNDGSGSGDDGKDEEQAGGTPTTPEKDGDNEKNAPKTGDTMNMTLWMMLMAAAGMLSVAVRRKKNN